MKILISSFILFIAFGGFTFAQMLKFGPDCDIGMLAPNFTLTKLLQAPSNAPTTLSALRGNIVVLEFWATWCSPCRTAMKHLSVIAEKFVNKPIRFLAISGEPSEVIEKYLLSRPNKLWIGIDGNHEAGRLYRAVLIPLIIIIDKDGKLLTVTTDKEITEERLDALLAGKSVDFEPMRILTAEEIFRKESLLIDRSVLPSVIVKSHDDYGGWDSITIDNDGRMLTALARPSALFLEAYHLQWAQIEVSDKSDKESLSQDIYFVNIILPKGDKQALRDTLKNIISRDLHIDNRIEKRKENVIVLRRIQGTSKPILSDALVPIFKYDRTIVTAVKQPIASIIKYLNTMFSVPIIDETGLKGEYDLSFSWDLLKKTGLEEGLALLGLEMVKNVEREVDICVVKRKVTSSN